MSANPQSHGLAWSRPSRNLLYVGGALLVIAVALVCFVRILLLVGGVVDTLLSQPPEGNVSVALQAADFELVSRKLRLTEESRPEESPVIPVALPEVPPLSAPSSTDAVSDAERPTTTASEPD